MDPWNQLYFMDLVHVGEFVLAYLLNPTSYGHETCTIGYSRDWGLKGCVKVLWQPHQMWSYGPMKSAMFHGFGLGWLICGTISPEPYKLWTWDLHHWIQQRLRFKRICGVKSPEPYILWTWDLHPGGVGQDHVHHPFVWRNAKSFYCFSSWEKAGLRFQRILKSILHEKTTNELLVSLYTLLNACTKQLCTWPCSLTENVSECWVFYPAQVFSVR